MYGIEVKKIVWDCMICVWYCDGTEVKKMNRHETGNFEGAGKDDIIFLIL